MTSKTEQWVRVAMVDDIPEGETCQVRLGGEAVCLYHIKDAIYATQDLCSHATASLAEGYIIDDNIECPMHQGLFHIPTGRAVGAPCTVDIKTYPVKVDGKAIFLREETTGGTTS